MCSDHDRNPVQGLVMTRELSVFHTIADSGFNGGASKVVVDLADALGKQPAIQPVLVASVAGGIHPPLT